MTSVDFTKACIPYNKKYRDMFGTIPCIQNFACNNEQFLDALKKSVDTSTPIEELLLASAEKDPRKCY